MRTATVEGTETTFYKIVSYMVFGKRRERPEQVWKDDYGTRRRATAAKRQWIKEAKIKQS